MRTLTKDACPAALRIHVFAHQRDALALQHKDEAIRIVVVPAIRQRRLHAFFHDHRLAVCVDALEFHRDVGDEKLRKRHREEVNDGIAPNHVVRVVECDCRGIARGREPLRVWREAGSDTGRVARGERAPRIRDDVLAGAVCHLGMWAVDLR